MQMTALRGSRTVMSLRLCSRAPWTTSSSTAIGPLYRPNVRSYRVSFGRVARGSRAGGQALRQRPNTRPPSVKPSPNVPTAKPPIAMPLRHGGEALPVAERLALLVGQRLASALLSQRAAGPKAEIEIVEDLDRLLVGHLTHCIACFAGVCTHPACQRPPRRRTGGPVRGVEAWPSPRRARGPRTAGRERRSDPSGHARAARSGRRSLLKELGVPVLAVPGNHDIPHTVPARFTSPWAEFERCWETTTPVYASDTLHVVGLNSVRPWRHQSGGLARRRTRREAAARSSGRLPARCAWPSCTIS